MSVTCTHEGEGVCPACKERVERAGREWNHAEVWRHVAEITESAFHDGGLSDVESTDVLAMAMGARGYVLIHERRAKHIEQGK